MNCLWQRSWHLQVERSGSSLISSCHYLDTYEEKRAVLEVNIQDFSIKKAEMIRLGHPGNYQENIESFDGLRGVTAYPGSGPEIRRILGSLVSAADRELINQCIIGAFQAETFIYKERGFASAEEYDQSGDEFLKGTCSYYSNLERITNTWSGYIGDSLREKYLFDRFKSQHLLTAGDDYWLIGSLNDTFHEVSTVLQLAKSNQQVQAAWGELLRAPDQVCRESTSFVSGLTGINISQISKKELAHLLGAQKGCVHLIDTIFDSAETLRLYLQNIQIKD